MKKDERNEVYLLLNTKRFNSTISKLRKKWTIAEKGIKDNKETNGLRRKLVTDAEFVHDVYEVINGFDQLSERWYQGLVWYIFDNNANWLFNVRPPYELKFDYEGETTDKAKNIQAVWIKVDARTTEDDWKKAFKQAKELLQDKPIIKPMHLWKHAKYAKQLKPDRELPPSWQVVAEQVNTKFSTDYDENSIRKKVDDYDKRTT